MVNVKSGVSQGLILGPLLFDTYINDLPNGLSSKAKLFDDKTSLFSVVHDSSITRNELNDDLVKLIIRESIENDFSSKSQQANSRSKF